MNGSTDISQTARGFLLAATDYQLLAKLVGKVADSAYKKDLDSDVGVLNERLEKAGRGTFPGLERERLLVGAVEHLGTVVSSRFLRILTRLRTQSASEIIDDYCIEARFFIRSVACLSQLTISERDSVYDSLEFVRLWMKDCEAAERLREAIAECTRPKGTTPPWSVEQIKAWAQQYQNRKLPEQARMCFLVAALNEPKNQPSHRKGTLHLGDLLDVDASLSFVGETLALIGWCCTAVWMVRCLQKTDKCPAAGHFSDEARIDGSPTPGVGRSQVVLPPYSPLPVQPSQARSRSWGLALGLIVVALVASMAWIGSSMLGSDAGGLSQAPVVAAAGQGGPVTAAAGAAVPLRVSEAVPSPGAAAGSIANTGSAMAATEVRQALEDMEYAYNRGDKAGYSGGYARTLTCWYQSQDSITAVDIVEKKRPKQFIEVGACWTAEVVDVLLAAPSAVLMSEKGRVRYKKDDVRCSPDNEKRSDRYFLFTRHAGRWVVSVETEPGRTECLRSAMAAFPDMQGQPQYRAVVARLLEEERMHAEARK